jgi:hypothetical protein
MHTFDHLLNWTLKAGSHPFPGPDGGTCINEAALVAAGFAYKPISHVRQMPRCFSRPICEYAMWLNDQASDEERQRLLPYVTRLACADTPEIEMRRASYIADHTRAAWDMPLMSAGLEVLEGALAIGRQAKSFAADIVDARFEAERSKARVDEAKTPVPLAKAELASAETISTGPILSKVKNWLSTREMG